MALDASINYLAVFVAAAVSRGLGFLWYGPLFGKVWIQLMGFDKKKMDAAKKKGMGKTMAAGFLSTLVMSYVLAHFVDYVEAKTILDGVMLGFWLWIGFFATAQLGSVIWEGKPVKLYALNTLHFGCIGSHGRDIGCLGLKMFKNQKP